MKIYIVTHGEHEDNHISLCTTDFDKAVNHYINCSKPDCYNCKGSIEIWEDERLLLEYGDMDYHLVVCKEDVTCEEIKEDILKHLNNK